MTFAGIPLGTSVFIDSGDALVVAAMQSEGLSQLASHDADFDRVPGVVRYAPV